MDIQPFPHVCQRKALGKGVSRGGLLWIEGIIPFPLLGGGVPRLRREALKRSVGIGNDEAQAAFAALLAVPGKGKHFRL